MKHKFHINTPQEITRQYKVKTNGPEGKTNMYILSTGDMTLILLNLLGDSFNLYKLTNDGRLHFICKTSKIGEGFTFENMDTSFIIELEDNKAQIKINTTLN